MKEDQADVIGRVVCPDTYLGTKMNEKALLFHTQLHEWSDAQNLAHAAANSKALNCAKQKEIFLPVKKLTQIEYWTRDVNKYYHPRRPQTARSGSFMYIDVSKYNIKDTERSAILRPKSAIVGSPRTGQRPISAVTTNSVPRRRFFGTDVNTIHNNLLESQFHYSALRKNIYSAKTVKHPANTKAYVVDQTDSVKPESNPKSYSNSTNESETIITLANSTGTKKSDVESQGQGHEHPQNMQPMITSRSWSNKMLNVISIDDCKLTCRYRPQKIKEQREPPTDYEDLDRQNSKNNKTERKTHSEATKTDKNLNNENHSESHLDADDEQGDGDNTELDVELDVNDIQLSPDRNNNEIIQQIIITEATPRNEDSDSDPPYWLNIKPTDETGNDAEDRLKNKDITDGTKEHPKDIANGHIEQWIQKQKEINNADQEVKNIINSQGTASKTSYGRITTLYSNSDTTNMPKSPTKKKISRTQRLNDAIDGMIGERKVMNAMTKDFDKRVSEFGRTIIDKQEGSENFKKMHSNLRKKMDQFIEYKSAMKTKQFLERRRLNSNSSSNAPSVISGANV